MKNVARAFGRWKLAAFAGQGVTEKLLEQADSEFGAIALAYSNACREIKLL